MHTHVYCRYRKFPSTVYNVSLAGPINIYKGIRYLYITLYSKVVGFRVIQFCFSTPAVADAIIVLFSTDFYFSSERGRRREGVCVCVYVKERVIVEKEKSFTLQQRIFWNWVFLEYANYISALILWCIYARNKRPLRLNYI